MRRSTPSTASAGSTRLTRCARPFAARAATARGRVWWRSNKLAEDHENARRFGEIVSGCEGVRLVFEAVETNLVFVDVSGAGVSARAVRDRLEERGINVGAYGDAVLRAATHLDVSRAQVEEAGQAFVEIVQDLAA